MKFIHTADWHLGKIVQGVYMTEDQRYVLEQLLETIEQERPDAVIIAGDIYDRAVPPAEAVELLDEWLERVVIDLATPVLAIAGNHDSPDRLDFATRIMEGQGLHLAGQLKREIKPVVLHDDAGEVHVYLVPYADPAWVRYLWDDESIRTHDDALRAVLGSIAEGLDPKARHVLVGHAFVTPGGEPSENTSDSERPLSVGGAEQVHAEYFAPFHYTALGHLHQAHHVLTERIRYAGSPLKYSISEEHHVKGYYMVELDANGAVKVEKRTLTPRRDLRRVTASLEEIQSHPVNEDYVFVTLTDEHPVLFPMEKIRAVYPNAMHVERQIRIPSDGESGIQKGMSKVKRESDPAALFESFYKEVLGRELDDELRSIFAATYDELLREEGERA